MLYTFNYSKLRGKIREHGYTQEEVAKKLNVAPATLSLKLNNASEFSQSEIQELCSFLDISGAEVSDYFFSCIV